MYDVIVVGGGRLGLPLSVLLAGRGFRTLVVDIDEDVVEKVNGGVNPFPHEAGMSVLGELVDRGLLRATTSYDDVPASPRVVFVAVSTGFDGIRINYGNVYDAVKAVAKRVDRNTVVLLKSVVPIGATRKIDRALRDKGYELILGFTVERAREGTMIPDLERYPVIYGVVDQRHEKRVGDLLRELGWKQVISVGSSEAAEFAKFASNTMLALMITYANILEVYAEHLGIDVWRVIDALNQGETHIPKIWRPGHYGGYCLTKDPAEFAYRALELNAIIPYDFLLEIPLLREKFVEWEVDVIELLLNGLAGKKILVLGKAFKAGTDDTRFSPAIFLAELLRRRGAHVEQYDPYVDNAEPNGNTRWDAVIVATPHPEFRDTKHYDHAELVVDLFNIVKEKPGRKIVVLGKPSGKKS